MNPLYPTFFITPYIEGKKHKILTGATPNTHILSSNSYELEIIRLLILFAGNDPAVIKLKERTCERLCASCFDNDCFIGECYDTGIVSLRFRCTATPDERQKLISLSNKIINHFNDKKRTLGIKMYMFLAFSELPRDLSKKYLEPYRDDLINIYNKYTIESTDLNKYIARNALECLDIKL